MADSDSDPGIASDENDAFDPLTNLNSLPEKERKKAIRQLEKWRLFIDFLFRHLCIVTYRYNCYESTELEQLMLALERAEEIRETMKLKKGETARISSFRAMKECADVLQKRGYKVEANRVRRFVDIAGRLRGISVIAGGFYKAVKKGKVKKIEKIKYYLDHWKGFCVRSYDYSEMPYRHADSEMFNALEKKFQIWPTAIRTGLNLAQKFMKKVSEATGLDLISSDPKAMQQHMRSAEFVLATKIEEQLFQRVVKETKSFILGTPLGFSSQHPMSATTQKNWALPSVVDIDPKLLKPISDDSILLGIPDEPPKEKKRKKKGKTKGKSSAKSKKRKKK